MSPEDLKLIEQIARKLKRKLPPCVDLGDLIQWGWMGWNEAQKRFDELQGNQFKTFAQWRIRGAMIDGLRRLDHIPRYIRDRGDKRKFVSIHDVSRHEQEWLESLEAEKTDPDIDRLDDFEHRIRGLKDREKQVLRERYCEDRSLADIARRRGVSPSYVVSIHGKATQFLKKRDGTEMHANEDIIVGG